MKKCPVCESVVDEAFECPICWATLTYEPECYDHEERYGHNKFYLRYLLRQCWFSMIALLLVLIATFLAGTGGLRICVFAWLAAIYSCVMGALQRKWVKLWIFKYSEEYAKFRVVFGKYVSATVAILVAIVMIFAGR